MASYNGEQYLQKQLDSISAQTYTNWYLYVSDDNSHDKTPSILEQFRQKHPERVQWRSHRSNCGFIKNFFSLILGEKREEDFFAFSDQDDIWYPDRLQRGLDSLSRFSEESPVLYTSQTEIIDSHEKGQGLSLPFKQRPTLKEVLIQGSPTGNTMLFNRKAYQLIRKTDKEVYIPLSSHDWWLSLLVSGYGGTIIYDQNPTVRYRQHQSNHIGNGNTWIHRFSRIKKMLQGETRERNRQHLEALGKFPLLSPESKKILEEFEQVREASLSMRCLKMIKFGIWGRTLYSSINLALATIMGKI